ncbi:MAG: hypothetical protein PHD51_00440 [Patescibacteria group bacterium]|nr:hypothetical protein [Patescibacteria group bacterium]MDD5490664.1 hypothetical protein [Patescibacteria group bacterium]
MFIEKEQQKVEEKKKITVVQWLLAILALGLIVFLVVWFVVAERVKARDVARVAYLKEIQAGLEMYFNDFNAYPIYRSLALGSGKALCLDANGFGDSCDGRIYLNYIPVAPVPADGRCTAELNAFTYHSEDGKNYQIDFCLGKTVGGLKAGVHAARFGEIK